MFQSFIRVGGKSKPNKSANVFDILHLAADVSIGRKGKNGGNFGFGMLFEVWSILPAHREKNP